MDTEILVREHIEIGRRLVSRARAHGLSVIGAYWFKDDERNYWRLIIISPDVPEKGPKWAYERVISAVYDVENDPAPLPNGTRIDHAMADEVYYATSVLSPATRMFADMQRSLTDSGQAEIRDSKYLGAYVYELTAAPQPVAG